MKNSKYFMLAGVLMAAFSLFAQDRNLLGVTVQTGYVPAAVNYAASEDAGTPKPWSRLRGPVNTLTTASITNDINILIDDASLFTSSATVYGAYLSGGISGGATGNINVDIQVAGISSAWGIYAGTNQLLGDYKGDISVKGAAISYGLHTASGMAPAYLTLSVYGAVDVSGTNKSYAVARTGAGGPNTGLGVFLHGSSASLSALTSSGLGYAIYGENTSNNVTLDGDVGQNYQIMGNLYSASGFDINSGVYTIKSDTWEAGSGFYTLASKSGLVLKQSVSIVTGDGDARALSLKSSSFLTMELFGDKDNISVDLGGYALELEAGAALNLVSNYLLKGGDSFELFTDVSTITGDDLEDMVVMLNGQEMEFGSDYDLSFTNGSIVLSVLPVPEPSAYAAIFGALALGAAYWRKRK